VGSRARPLAGLREVPDARLAPIDGLASGSASARAAQADYAVRHGLPVEVVDMAGIHYRLIPPGTFLMGSPDDEPGHWEGEIQHTAMIPRPFYLSATEITQAQWKRVMPDRPLASSFHGEQRPVEEVTWYDAVRFTRRLCEINKVPEGTYRLPTEAEWEYACRAGTDTPWCCGDDPARLTDYADFVENNNVATNRVARRRPNAWGLFDMHGNVWEWCLEKYRPYPGSTEPFPEEIRSWRVIRGGNWQDPAVNCRSANRCRLSPASHWNILGFRVVRVLLREEMKSAATVPASSGADGRDAPTGSSPKSDAAASQEAALPAP